MARVRGGVVPSWGEAPFAELFVWDVDAVDAMLVRAGVPLGVNLADSFDVDPFNLWVYGEDFLLMLAVGGVAVEADDPTLAATCKKLRGFVSRCELESLLDHLTEDEDACEP